MEMNPNAISPRGSTRELLPRRTAATNHYDPAASQRLSCLHRRIAQLHLQKLRNHDRRAVQASPSVKLKNIAVAKFALLE